MMMLNKIISNINTYRSLQLQRNQTNLLEQFFDDKELAHKASHHPSHASLADWLPIEANKHILELGCGPGKYVAMLSSIGFNVTGLDPVFFPTWEVLRKRESITLMDKVFAETLPFEDYTFDHSVCLGAVLYFDDPLKAMLELKRVTKPGGRIIIKTVNSQNFYSIHTGLKLDPASKNLFNMEELCELVQKSGLTIVRRFSYGFWPPVKTDLWWYLQCVWIPLGVQNILSNLTKENNRVNNILYCLA